MSQKDLSTNPASVYDLKAVFYTGSIDKDGYLIEVPKEETITLWKLQRTNKAHSKFILHLMRAQEGLSEIDIDDLAVEFVSIAVKDDNLRKELEKDLFACMTIFTSDEVKEDINRFFALRGFLPNLSSQASSK